MNLKKSFVSIFLALVVVVLTFCVAVGEVRAADDKKFEVTLQTPFAPLPTASCIKSDDDKKTTTKQSGETFNWICRKDSIIWQQVIQGDDGGEILADYAALIYKFLAGLIGVVAVLMIVAGGIEIATAGANQNGLQSGRDRILAALVGLAILFLASLILYTINPNFFVNSSPT